MNGAGATGAAAPRVVRRYHFHFPGVLYVAVTLFLAVGAINSQNNLLFAALGLSMGGLMISGILSGASLLGLQVRREPITGAAVGAPVSVAYTISNSNRLFPAFGLNIVELPAPGDRAWQRLIPAFRAFAAQVGPRRTVRVETVATPIRRGVAEFHEVRIWTTFPFGLTRKSVTFELPATAIVRPAELPLRRGAVENLIAQAPTGAGAERAPGPGEEFFGLRDYVPGDSPRWIAWRRSARTGQLIVRQQAAPAPLRLWVVLALPSGFESGDPMVERAVTLAAALVRTAAAGGGGGVAVGLVCGGTFRSPIGGVRNAERLVQDLAIVDGSAAGLPKAGAIGRAGACVVVSLDGSVPPGLPRQARGMPAAMLDSLVSPGDVADRILSLLGPIRPGGGRALGGVAA